MTAISLVWNVTWGFRWWDFSVVENFWTTRKKISKRGKFKKLEIKKNGKNEKMEKNKKKIWKPGKFKKNI